MRIVYEFSHLGGSEILAANFPQHNQDIIEAINSIRDPGKTKVSREKTKAGRMLYEPAVVNGLFREAFRAREWAELKQRFQVEIPGHPVLVRGFKQCDFYKSPILCEVQLGKYFAMLYDLMKFQYFHLEREIKVGVEIVPARSLARQMSTGVSNGEMLIGDLIRLRGSLPAVPVKVVLVDF
jgi:hypothetical protein